jgi:hypothetical protein
MRIETLPYKNRGYTPSIKEEQFGYGGSKMKHTQTQVLTP